MAVCEQLAGNSSFPTLDDRDLAEALQWLQSKWHNPPKVVFGPPSNGHLGVCAIYPEIRGSLHLKALRNCVARCADGWKICRN